VVAKGFKVFCVVSKRLIGCFGWLLKCSEVFLGVVRVFWMVAKGFIVFWGLPGG